MAFLETKIHDGDDHVPAKAELLDAREDDAADDTTSTPLTLSPSLSDSDWEEVEHPNGGVEASDQKHLPPSEKSAGDGDFVTMEECTHISEAGEKKPEDGHDLDTTKDTDLDTSKDTEYQYLPLLKTISDSCNVQPSGTCSDFVREGGPVCLSPTLIMLAKQRTSSAISFRSLAWLAVLILGIASAYLVLEFQFWDSVTEPAFSEPTAPAIFSVPEAPVVGTVTQRTVAVARAVSQPTIMRRGRTDIVPRSPSTAVAASVHESATAVFVSTEKHNFTGHSRIIVETAHNRISSLARAAHDLITQWILHARYALVDPTIQYARIGMHEISVGLKPVFKAIQEATETIEIVIETVKDEIWRIFRDSGAQDLGIKILRGAKRVRKFATNKAQKSFGELEQWKNRIVATLKKGNVLILRE